MHPYSGSFGGGFGFFDFAWHVVGLLFIIWVLMMIFRRPRGGRWHMQDMWQSHSAVTILNERYAKGEISKEEYEERKKTLTS